MENPFKKIYKKQQQRHLVKPEPAPFVDVKFTKGGPQNLALIKKTLNETGDLVVREIRAAGIAVNVLAFEGMFGTLELTSLLLTPLSLLDMPLATPERVRDWLVNESALGMDTNQTETVGELFPYLMSGFAGVLIDGVDTVIVTGVQGFQYRSVAEPSSEENVRGSREGFVEPIKINASLVRRRMKCPTLKLEYLKIGVESKTDICLAYQTDMVSPELLEDVKRRIDSVDVDLVLESGYIQPFLDTDIVSMFSNVGTTERPDTFCAKISEGRIGILVDGTPFALIVPYFFHENFQSVDDYTHRPYYAVFERWLKYLAFFFTILLPGLYVALGTFHPELLPQALLLNVAEAEQKVPFTLMAEALLIHFIYELMREAGLRLPRAIGHAIGIIGALVIGDAAVSARLISSPMVMVVAITALSSFVVPSLFQEITVMRFLFIIIGGTLGLFGVSLGLALMCVNLCAVNAYGVPSMSPGSPFGLFAMRDVFWRTGWKKLGRRKIKIQNLPGSEIK